MPPPPIDQNKKIEIYKKARNLIMVSVEQAASNESEVDLSPVLSNLSNLDIATHYEVSQRLSTELEKYANDPKTKPELQKSYRQCQQQILEIVYQKARNLIMDSVEQAASNKSEVDLSPILSNLSNLDIATHYEVSQRLSTELEKYANDPKTEPELQKSYRQCQQQILTQGKVIYAKIHIEIIKKSSSNSSDATYKIDLSESLKQLSNVSAESWILITEKLSTELKNAVNDRNTPSKLQERYRQCLSQIDSLPIPEEVARKYNQHIQTDIQTLVEKQWDRTSNKRRIGYEDEQHNTIRIDRITSLTQHLLSQKIDIESGKTITYGQLQARELLIRELTNTEGNKQTKALNRIIEERQKEGQAQSKETTSTGTDQNNQTTRTKSVIASKRPSLLQEANTIVRENCKFNRTRN